jgi:hypothetical protein
MSKKVKIQIKHYFTGSVLFEYECEDNTISKTVQEAVSKRADLSGADLSGAYLSGANLSGANLRSADLSGANLRSADLSGAYLRSANLRSADLSGANLSGADLSGAYLRSADLSGANLSGANLRSADLSGANLSGAYLRSANLRSADLSGANLRSADLRSADLSGADLSGAKNADLAIAMTRILPEGQLIGYKKCRNGVIVKLQIPAKAKRSHAFGRKCRAEYAKVLHIYGATEAVSTYDQTFVYRKGEIVRPDKWDDDWTDECSSGVHFFITREEAEAYV